MEERYTDMKEKIMKWIPLLVLLVFLLTIFVPRWMNNRTAMTFGEPLFAYPLPVDSEVISQDGAVDDEGGVTAAILMKTDLTSEQRLRHYADLVCQPAKEGQHVTMEAKALTEADLDVLKQARVYEEGASYQFIYVYSK